jgi:hypothetical protein
VTYNNSLTWDLKLVDKLHTLMCKEPEGEHGFFTLEEYTSKEHTQSVLHLVMHCNAANGTAYIFAMLPVKAGEISLTPAAGFVDEREEEEEGDEVVPKKTRIKRKRAGVHEDDARDDCGGDSISDIALVRLPALTFDTPGIRNLLRQARSEIGKLCAHTHQHRPPLRVAIPMGLVTGVMMSSPLGAMATGAGATPAWAVIVRAMSTGRRAAASLAPAER